MAIIYDDVVLGSGSLPPSLSSLIGSSVSIDVFDAVNSNGFATMFGSDFNNLRMDFYEKHIKPNQQLDFEIARTVNMVMNPDKIRMLTTMEDYLFIPAMMQMPILMFEPVRRAFEQGRIEGFGFDPTWLPEEDVYGRLINNFHCEDVALASDENGYYEITGTMYSDDPEFSANELYEIRKTREYIEREILGKTNLDPTAIELPRG